MYFAALIENKIGDTLRVLNVPISKSPVLSDVICYLVMDKLDERIVMRVAALLIKQATTVKQRRKARTRRCMMPRSVTPSELRLLIPICVAAV